MATSTIQKKNMIMYKVLECTGTYTAGTIGTRGAQFSIPISDIIDVASDYYIIGAWIFYISDSAKFYPLVFYSSDSIYCNFYRATESALTNGKVSVRIVFVHKNFIREI